MRVQIAAFSIIGACVVALLWAIVFAAIRAERDSAVDHARVEASNLSAAFMAEVSGKLDATMRIMGYLVHHLRTEPDFDLYDWAREHNQLISTMMVSAWVVAPDGTRTATTRGQGLPRLNLSDREYFQVHRDRTVSGTYIGPLMVGRVSGEAGIPISRKIDAPDGRFLGVLVFSLMPDHLTVLHKSANIGKGGVLTLVGDDGIVRARFTADGADSQTKAGWQVPAPLAAAGRPDQTYIGTSTIDGAVRLYSVRQVAPYPLRVTVGFDMSDVLTVANAHARQIQAAALAATLTLGGLLVLLVLEIRRRADREARLAAEIDRGAAIQRRLRASEARLRDYAEMASDWFWEQDETLRFTEIGAEAPLRMPDGRWSLGKCRWDLVEADENPALWAAHKRDLLERVPIHDFRYSYTDASGKRRHVSINGVPVFDDSGRFKGYRGTGRDVTHETEAAETLRRSRDEAAAANRAKSAFLSNMSHELRTPLNAIIGFSELIRARTPEKTVEQCSLWAGDILSSGLQLLHVLNDIIALSRIESGRHGLSEDRVDIGQAVRTAVAAVLRRSEDNRVSVDRGMADIGLIVRADARAIQQVLQNVVANAVKFSPDGGVVTIRAEMDDGEAAIVVSDTGIGLDPDALAVIEEPFAQADSTIGRRHGGTGLGLTISRKLVELHGGSLSIDSIRGQGTTVRIALPAARIMARREKTPAPF